VNIQLQAKWNDQEISDNIQSMYTTKSSSDIKLSTTNTLKIVPKYKKGETTFKLVKIYQVTNATDINDIVLIDQFSSDIIETISKTNHADTGHVEAYILPVVSTDTPELRSLDNLKLTIGATSVLSDSTGNFVYTIEGSSANLSTQLKGSFANVINYNATDALISKSIMPNDTVKLVWSDSNSSMSERNVFYHINEIHKHNKEVDKDFTGLDFPLQCIVNDNSATCNAFWNGTNLHFNTQGAGCTMNSAHGTSVIYHEYGHAINDKLYNQLGMPFGLKSHTLHEAFSDIYACLLLNDSRFALGWTGPGTFTRNLDNNNVYPTSLIGNQHYDGLILGGAFWDLGLLTSPSLAYELAHFAKYGTPDDADLGVAFSEVFLETLIADDNDGNLLNGTPNSVAIDNAFCQHGIGSNLFAIQHIDHIPQANTVDTENDYHIEISLSQPTFMEQALSDVKLIYTTNNFNSTTSVPFEAINSSSFEAYIPNQDAGSLIKYYFSIPDGNCGNQLLHPSWDYLSENYSFYVGDYTLIFDDDFDVHKGWQYGNSSDNATSGFWERGNPQQTISDNAFEVQPEDDYTQNGTNCLVTGKYHGNFWYSNDVDGGKTTVTSPVFSDLDSSAIISFYKWFVHGAGFVFPANGKWITEITNNGTNWVEIENTGYGDHRYWINSKYKISDFVSATDQIQIRFVASDAGAGSIVEALVDNFSILILKNALDVHENVQNLKIKVYPNPSGDWVRLSIDSPEEVSLTIYNAYGLAIKTIPDVKNSYVWTAKSDGIADGVYFYKVQSLKGKQTGKIVLHTTR
jgi:hypothetical protein